MKVHEKNFIIPYRNIILDFELSTEFNSLEDDFAVVTKDFNKYVGYESITDVKTDDNIIYAKRKGREIYTKFVAGRDTNEKTTKVTFILKRNNKNRQQYYLITMYAGDKSEKEPEDRNIGSLHELIRSVSFWDKKALIFNEEDIERNTIRNDCPYILTIISKVIDFNERQHGV